MPTKPCPSVLPLCVSWSWGRWLHHLPGQTVSMPYRSFWEEMFPNIQPGPPLSQLEAAVFCPRPLPLVFSSICLNLTLNSTRSHSVPSQQSRQRNENCILSPHEAFVQSNPKAGLAGLEGVVHHPSWGSSPHETRPEAEAWTGEGEFSPANYPNPGRGGKQPQPKQNK